MKRNLQPTQIGRYAGVPIMYLMERKKQSIITNVKPYHRHTVSGHKVVRYYSPPPRGSASGSGVQFRATSYTVQSSDVKVARRRSGGRSIYLPVFDRLEGWELLLEKSGVEHHSILDMVVGVCCPRSLAVEIPRWVFGGIKSRTSVCCESGGEIWESDQDSGPRLI